MNGARTTLVRDCDTIAAEADGQDAAPVDVHVVSATAIDTPDGVHHLSMCGTDLGAYRQASAVHPVGNYLTPTSPHMRRVTCAPCRDRIVKG